MADDEETGDKSRRKGTKRKETSSTKQTGTSSHRKNAKVMGGSTGAAKKGGSGGNGGDGDTPSNTKEETTTTIPSRGNGKGKDVGDGHKTADDAQKRDEDDLVAAVDYIEKGGDNTEQVVSPLFVLYAIIYGTFSLIRLHQCKRSPPPERRSR